MPNDTITVASISLAVASVVGTVATAPSAKLDEVTSSAEPKYDLLTIGFTLLQ